MKLYVCGAGTGGPGALHPCAKAGNALDEAGHTYDLVKVGGYRLMPWTWKNRAGDRKEVKELSGSNEVPILVLDNGDVISDSAAIAKWAKENPAAA
ncbi:MAG TPA: glutathione S-transferase domain-containing protein [Solirubrobacterales bacterium]|nr:glutathione S-transferase domain-containing protein [Solirubrobacterales bacterium]